MGLPGTCCQPLTGAAGRAATPDPTLHPRRVPESAVEEQLALVTSSGRPFQLIDVRVVAEDGADVAKDGVQVRPVLPSSQLRG